MWLAGFAWANVTVMKRRGKDMSKILHVMKTLAGEEPLAPERRWCPGKYNFRTLSVHAKVVVGGDQHARNNCPS
jgi:hypothetical protein